MNSTSISLLRQAQKREPGAWERFQGVYEPLLRFWVQRDAAARSEADDLVQDLLLTLHQQLPSFERRRTGSFRKWLRVLATNRVKEFLRKKKPELHENSLFDRLANPSDALLAEWNAEYERQVVANLFTLAKPEFESTVWLIFEETELRGVKPRDVAQAQNVPISAVYRARFQVLTRLRLLGQEVLEKE